ncbi:MAG: NAD(P)H-hydrate dehydratase, partial [Moorella sp. (in: Bacteria)]|nr:NAD(P)H-hydrate dehydratase [Moorella sp. (in: firmicutes)]
LLGTGIRGTVAGVSREIIDMINDAGVPVLSVDIPSGIDADTGAVCGTAVKAAKTVTMALPKAGLLLYPGAGYCGQLEVADIGIPRNIVESAGIFAETLDTESVAALFPRRRPDTHKGDYGRVLIIAGSPGLTGAAVLAGRAAARSGSGLVTVGVPRSVYPIVASKLTEVMTLPLPDDPGDGTIACEALPVVLERAGAGDVVAAGPGLSTGAGAEAVVRGLVEKSPVPVVIDADGINCLARDPSVLKAAKSPVVLTPHPGEMARLMGRSIKEIQADRPGWAKKAAALFGCCVVLKGARTVTALPGGEIYINLTGNPGMATGGSGDVLTGI